MSEKYLVLGALVRNGPASVTDLDEWVHERSGFLGLDERLVEQAVVELCADGLIEGTGEMRAGTTRPRERVIYAATDLGSAELDRWLRQPPSQADLEAMLPSSSDWIPEEITNVAQIDAVIAEASRREARARRDLGDNKLIRREEMDSANRPWPEVARDLVHNSEVRRLEAEIESMVFIQTDLKEFREELQAAED